MAFEQSPDGLGKIYIPESACGKKKNPCRDCFSCQWCSDDRCKMCQPQKFCQEKQKDNEKK